MLVVGVLSYVVPAQARSASSAIWGGLQMVCCQWSRATYVFVERGGQRVRDVQVVNELADVLQIGVHVLRGGRQDAVAAHG